MPNAFSVIAVAVTLLAASSAVLAGRRVGPGPSWDQLDGYTFEKYVKDYNLNYKKDSTEYHERRARFNARLDDIRQHNADKSKSWKRGVNQFTDWSNDEWIQYNRAKPSFFGPGTERAQRKYAIREFPKTNVRELPSQVDYRSNNFPTVLTGIKNQAACGNCWAHACVESVESYFALQTGQLPVLSTQQITSCTTTMNGCGGGSYVSGWEYVQASQGLNEEWVYPFVNFFCDPPLSESCTQKCRDISKDFLPNFKWYPKTNISQIHRVKPNDAVAMMEALAHEGPVAISVGSDQWPDYESGILQNNYSTVATNITWQSINHAVQLVGYGYDMDLNLDYWVVRNSWGTNYGENGFIRLLRPKHEPCGNATGYEVCGTSGLLCDGAYPKVGMLEKQNGPYF